MPTCEPPLSELPPRLRFRMLATLDPRDPEEDNIEVWLPQDDESYSPLTIGYFQQGFIKIDPLFLFSVDFTTDLGELTIELKDVFVPVRIEWKHYTQDNGTLSVSSSDESIVLTSDDPSYTWPLSTFTEAGVTDGEWDGDFTLHETV